MDNALVLEFLQQPEHWISGLYILEELCPVFIVASSTSDTYSVSYYNYSFWESGDEAFEPYARLIWPVDNEEIFTYRLEGPNFLNINTSIWPDGFADAADEVDWCNPIEIAELMVPHLEPLELFDPEVHEWDSYVQDADLFAPIAKKFKNRPTPDFWAQSQQNAI
jgi:hypothetical protein